MLTTENKLKASNSKITEALELLNEAAREKKDEVRDLLTDRYSHIVQAVKERGEKVVDHARYVTKESILEGEKKIKELVSEADSKVRKDPWPYIAGATVFSLLLGYVLGSKRR